MANLSRAATRQAWIDRIERFSQSDLSVAQFCLDENVSAASFYHWRRKLSPAPDEAASAMATSSIARFVPVKLPTVTQPQPATVMSVELPGGVRIRFEVGSTETSRS